MKNILVLNISFLIIFATLFLLQIKTNDITFIYIISGLYLLYFLSKRLIYRQNLKEFELSIKLSMKSKLELILPILSIIFSLILISNYWFHFISESESLSLLFVVISIILIIQTIENFNQEIIFGKNFIAYKNDNQFTKWSDIKSYEIEKSSLVIRTPHTKYWIPFDQFNIDFANDVVSILNKKLPEIFKGDLVYEKPEIKIIENKA